jgi:DNA repair protein RecN (Recombination protein N)
MLRRLAVKNLAIVEDLELELGPGLTVITGETGAGKSILVDALALLAGGRGSADLVRRGADRLVVSAELHTDAPARRILAEAGLAEGETVLLRREFSPDGRGRVFVEDAPATVRTLSRVAARLVAIHGQSSERELTDPGAPLELLDAFAGAQKEREATAGAAERWRKAREELEALQSSRRDRAGRLETLEYQIREIEGAAPDEKEEERLRIERERLLHADRIRRASAAALAALSEEEGSAADRVGEAARAFAELAAIDPREQAHREEAEDLKRRIRDLAAAARDAAGDVEGDPERLTAVEGRLEKLSRLKRKYGHSLAEVLAVKERLARERDELLHFEDALERRQGDEAVARLAYHGAAGSLSAKRRAAAGRFSSAIEKELRALALEKARLRVALEAQDGETPRTTGLETATLLFAPNPGEEEKPLEKIASGGELSRLQLAIRSVAAGRGDRGRTLVFDEVDAGIGGRTAEVVGKKLRELARHDQVLCVTHVPQIAALADRQFLAEKGEVRGRTVASVRLLEGRDRIAEIARMLAGEKVPETAWRHARTLLEAARS